ncbi:MAG: hypothetical protein JWN04_6300 [Myxococcaceae bacterium]|nr:hypothetical protein [Myxococcaceae bacterium]
MKESLVTEGLSRSVSTLGGLQTTVRSGHDALRGASSDCLLGSWVAETLLIAERAAAGSPEALSLFWIRLYGVLTDVADFVALTLDDAQAHDGLCMFPLARGRSDASPLPMAMARVKSLFDDDELLYLEYRRHAECDPFQTRYRTRRRPGAAAQVPSALLDGRPVSVEVAETAYLRLLTKFDFDEQRLGVELARRSVSALRALHLAAG